MNEPVIGVLLLLGGFFSAVAGIGILRLPDVLVRMHASTKAGTLGVGLIVIGVAFHFDSALVVAKSLLIVLFLLLTAPVGAHLIGRAAYRSGTPLWKGTVIDERDRMYERGDGSGKGGGDRDDGAASEERPVEAHERPDGRRS